MDLCEWVIKISNVHTPTHMCWVDTCIDEDHKCTTIIQFQELFVQPPGMKATSELSASNRSWMYSVQ